MDLREETIKFIKDNGIKKKHLASVIGIHACQLTLWLKGEWELNSSRTKIVEDFIRRKG